MRVGTVGQRDRSARHADAVDVTLDDVTTESVCDPYRSLEVDGSPGLSAAERGAVERLGDGIHGPPPVPEYANQSGNTH